MLDNNRDPLLWLLGFLLAAWIGGTLALAYMDWRLQMASRNIAGVAEMAAAIHNTREAGDNHR